MAQRINNEATATVYFNTKIVCRHDNIADAIGAFKFYSSEGRDEGIDTALSINGIWMPSMDDETFFYASVKAAEEDKVWLEEAHAFVTKDFKSSFEGGCLDDEDGHILDEMFSEQGGWNAFILDNIYQDVFGYNPVTTEDGKAVVYDKDVADLCEENGYEVLPCVKETEEGMMNYWIIFPQDDEEEYSEEEYFEEEYPETSDEDYSKYDEWIFANSPETGEICYYGDKLHAFYNTWEGTGTFYLDGWYTREYFLSEKDWKKLVLKIANNTEDYTITKSSEPNHSNGEYLKHRLEEMPFDRYEDGIGFIHATGWEYFEIDGTWYIEYEGDFE